MQRLSGIESGSAVQSAPAAAATPVNRLVEAAPGSATPGTTTRTFGDKDEARVSNAGNLIRQALTTPDVRTDKIAALQQSIAQGSYSIPSGDVAEKLVASLLH